MSECDISKCAMSSHKKIADLQAKVTELEAEVSAGVRIIQSGVDVVRELQAEVTELEGDVDHERKMKSDNYQHGVKLKAEVVEQRGVIADLELMQSGYDATISGYEQREFKLQAKITELVTREERVAAKHTECVNGWVDKVTEQALVIEELARYIRKSGTPIGTGDLAPGSCYCCNPDTGMEFGECDINTCESRWIKWAEAKANPEHVYGDSRPIPQANENDDLLPLPQGRGKVNQAIKIAKTGATFLSKEATT